jgi:hypothetical protein
MYHGSGGHLRSVGIPRHCPPAKWKWAAKAGLSATSGKEKADEENIQLGLLVDGRPLFRSGIGKADRPKE